MYQEKRIINNYEYINYVICKPSGYFMRANGFDAYIISELLEYKLLPDKDNGFKVGFPYVSIEKVSDILSNHNINHVFIKGGKAIIQKEFKANDYLKYLKGYQQINDGTYIFPETKGASKEINIKCEDDIISLNSKVTFRDCKTNELLTFTILPSFKTYKIKGMGGSYYGATYEEIEESFADPIEEGTISEKSSMAMVLLGHKAGDTVIYSNKNGDKYTYYIEEINNNGKVYGADKTYEIRPNIELSPFNEIIKIVDDPSIKVLSNNTEKQLELIEIIDALLMGVDPYTGEVFDDEHILLLPKVQEIIKIANKVIVRQMALDKKNLVFGESTSVDDVDVINNITDMRTINDDPYQRNYSLMIQNLDSFISKKQKNITSIKSTLRKIKKEYKFEKKIRTVSQWLLQQGFLEEIRCNNNRNSMKVATQKGNELGISTEHYKGSSDEYYLNMYNEASQRYIIKEFFK